MKKISLKNLPIDSQEMLTKEQLKNVFGGQVASSGGYAFFCPGLQKIISFSNCDSAGPLADYSGAYCGVLVNGAWEMHTVLC